jgi:hypothetical protein
MLEGMPAVGRAALDLDELPILVFWAPALPARQVARARNRFYRRCYQTEQISGDLAAPGAA